jgi:hypothetical protein
MFLSQPFSDVSAKALKSYNTVFFGEEFLISTPKAVLEAVAVHETVHLLVGCEVSRTLRRKHRDVTDFLHSGIIPAWLRGETAVRADDEYLSTKAWRDLYGGWKEPMKVQVESACEAVEMYFTLLKEGLVWVTEGRVFAIPPLARGHAQPKHPVLDQPFQNVTDDMTLCIVTGVELAAYLEGCVEATLSNAHGTDLGTLEEAFANYVASNLTGVPLDEIQRWAPQDEVKIWLAKQVLEVHPPIDKLISDLMTYDDLIEVGCSLGLVKKV